MIYGKDYDKVNTLRGCFAASLKYCPQYGLRQDFDNQECKELWMKVIKGEKLPENYTLDCVCGDYFAFWFNQLRIDHTKYDEIAYLFFENPFNKK